MAIFSYRAINDDGKEVSGTIDAPTLDAAREAIGALHLELKDIAESTRAGRQGTIIKPQAVSSPAEQPKQTQGMPVPDLAQWQPMQVKKPDPPSNEIYRHTVRQEGTPDVSPAPVVPQPRVPDPSKRPGDFFQYLPIAQTFRLYCGWLLAWYGLFVALGHYSSARQLPFDLPVVQGFYTSPLIFSFVVAIFLFLLLTSVQKALKAGTAFSAVLAAIGIGIFFYARSSVG